MQRLLERARLVAHVLKSVRRSAAAYTNALLASLLVSVLLVGTGPVSGTWASFTASQPDASNVLATAKQFTISDLVAVGPPGGTIVLTWSAASWAQGGYSVRRRAGLTGPFDPIVGGTTAVGVTTFTDTTALDGATWYYQVYGLSIIGGAGTGSDIVMATADATPPVVSSTAPVQGATASQSTSVLVTFSEAMNQALTGTSFALVGCTTSACTTTTAPLVGALSWPSTTSLAFDPAVGLPANAWYGMQLTTTATDVAGNPLSLAGCPNLSGPATTCRWSFQTGTDTAASGLKGAAPQNGSTNVPLNARISFVYNAALCPIGKTEAQTGFSLEELASNGTLVCYVYSGSGATPQCASYDGALAWPTDSGSTFAPTAALRQPGRQLRRHLDHGRRCRYDATDRHTGRTCQRQYRAQPGQPGSGSIQQTDGRRAHRIGVVAAALVGRRHLHGNARPGRRW
jgi:Bacterial Ig-like domain